MEWEQPIPVVDVDQLIAAPRSALQLDDGDQIVSAILTVEYLAFDGEHAGDLVLAWSLSDGLPAYRAVGMLDVVRRRQLHTYGL